MKHREATVRVAVKTALLLLVLWPRPAATKESLPERPADLPVALSWRYLEASLNAIYFTDSRKGWAVGDGGTVLATIDGGTTWQSQQSGVAIALKSVHFSSAKVGWIGGDEGVLLTTVDSGRTWRRVSTRDSEKKTLNAVFFFDERMGFVLTANMILSTEDGGKSWVTQSFHESGALHSIAFADLHTGWILGDRFILKTIEGGKHWRVSWRGAPRSDTLLSLCMANLTTGWSVGAGGAVLVTTDGGEHWTRQISNTDANLNSVSCVSATTAWSVGVNGTIAATSDSGRHWRPAQSGIDSTLSAVHFVSQDAGWVALDGGAILATTDGGQHWRSQHAPLPANLLSLRFVTPSTGWAVGTRGTILFTINGGLSWTNQESHTSAAVLRSVFFADSRKGWIVGDSGSKGTPVILTTEDAGKRWAPQASPAKGTLRSVFFTSTENGIAVGDNGTVIATADSGRSWQPQTSHVSSSLNSVYFANAYSGWAVGDHGVILATTNAGKDWQLSKEGDVDLYSVYFVNPVMGWAVGGGGYGGVVLATSDGGKHWRKQVSEALSDCSLNSVHFQSSTTGWAVGGLFYEDACIVATSDGGETWEAHNNFGDATLNAIDVAGGALKAWAVGDDGNILVGIVEEVAPYASDFRVGYEASQVRLSWEVRRPTMDQFKCSRVEYRIKGKEEWQPIDMAAERVEQKGGKFSFSWDPASDGIRDGTELQHRISLETKHGLVYRQPTPGFFRYQPWWKRQSKVVQTLLLAAAAIGGYVVLAVALLHLYPLGLLWLYQNFEPKDAAKLVPGIPFGGFVIRLLAASGLPYLARHPKTRRAWVARYLIGAVSFAALKPVVRNAFVRDPDCLDAWVERRWQRAAEALGRLQELQQHRIYVELPLRLATGSNERVVPEPKPGDFRAALEEPCAIAVIVGEGGSGKTTLACQLARWALAAKPAERLTEQRVIPVFLEGEIDSVFGSVKGHLRELVGATEVDDDCCGRSAS